MDKKSDILNQKPLPLSPEILAKIRQIIPTQATKEVKLGKRAYTAIKAYYIIERLNEIFGEHGWSHTCEVIFCDSNEAAVKGKLILWDYGIVIEEMGGHSDKDVGNRIKGAKTSSLSKCTSVLGMGGEIYAQSYKNTNTQPKKTTTTPQPQPKKEKKTIKVSVENKLLKVLDRVAKHNNGQIKFYGNAKNLLYCNDYKYIISDNILKYAKEQAEK